MCGLTRRDIWIRNARTWRYHEMIDHVLKATIVAQFVRITVAVLVQEPDLPFQAITHFREHSRIIAKLEAQCIYLPHRVAYSRCNLRGIDSEITWGKRNRCKSLFSCRRL